MKQWFDGVKSVMLALVAAAAVAFSPVGAEAHIYSIIPTSSDVEVGDTHTIISSLTMTPLETQYSMYFMGMDAVSLGMLSATLVYADGTRSDEITDFEDYDNPETTYMEDIYEAKPDTYSYLAGVTWDGYKAEAEIEQEGTVIVESGFYGYWYSKNIINLTADEGSMQETGDGEWEEIIPLEDLANAEVGTPIKFKVIYKGEAESDRTIYYANEESEYTYNEGEASNSNLTELTTSDEDGIFYYTPETYGTHALVADADYTNNIYYSTTLTFTLAEPTEDETEDEEEMDEEEEDTSDTADTEDEETEESVDTSDTEDFEEESEDTAEEEDSSDTETEEEDASDTEDSDEETPVVSTPGGGGCNAGFGGLALLVLALVTIKKHEK